MSTVDNRVIRMTFDNAQFEKNIKTTMNTLSDFEKSLKLDGATAGFEELKKSTDKLDMSAIGNKAAKEAGRVSESASDAAKSLDSIDKAADDVDMSGLGRAANSAANEVNEAASSIDMSAVSNEANSAAEGFSAFSVVAIGALLKVGDSITDLVQNKLMSLGSIVKKYTIDPITQGFEEYQQQIGSIQTILANTGMDFDSDEDIQRVNDALDELNRYADETIYKFGDMTQAIGTFTASGMELEDAVAAVKGVANVAAFSGASASDVHRVLPQIAQALSAGSVTLQDWRSIETANMASRGFVKTIGNVAKHMAEVEKASYAAAEAGQALIDKQVTMRQALNKTDNKDWAGWLTSDILSETLKAFTYDMTSATKEEKQIIRDHLAEIGFLNKEEQDELIRQAEMATRAATEVRTWSQLWDTVGESIGSNWAGIWRNLIGDFKQATDTFTFLSNTISDAVDGMLGGFVKAASAFNDSGAIDLIFGGFKRYTKEDFENGVIDSEDLINTKAVDDTTNELIRITGALDNLIEMVAKPLRAIGDAFDEVFYLDDETLSITLVTLALAFKDFTETLIISDDAASGIREIFEGLFSVLDLGIQVVLDAGAAFFGLLDIIRSITDPLIDIALVLGGQIGKQLLWAHDRFLEIRAAVIEAIQPILELISIVKNLINEFFGFAAIPDQIESFGDFLISIYDILYNFVDLPGKIRLIGDALKGLFGFIGDLTGWNKAVQKSNETFEQTGERVSAVKYWIDDLLKTPVGQFFSALGDIASSAFGRISTLVSNILDSINKLSTKFNETFATAIDKLSGPLSRLGSSIIGVFDRFGNFVINLKPIQDFFNLLISIKDTIMSFFGGSDSFGIDEWLSNLFQLPDNFDVIDIIASGINGLADALDNLTFESFINSINSAKETAIEFFEGVYDYVSNLTPEKLLNDIAKAFDNIRKKITKAISAVRKAVPPFDALVEALSNSNIGTDSPFLKFIDGVKNALGGILSFLSNVGVGFITFGKNVYNSIRENEAAMSILDGLKNTVSGFIDNLISGIGDFIKTLSEISVEDIVNTLTNIGDVVGKIFGSIVEILNNTGTVVGSVFEEIIKHLGDMGSKIKDFVVDVTTGKTDLISVLSEIVDWIKTNIFHIGDDVEAELSDIPGAMDQALSKNRSAKISILPDFDNLSGDVESGLSKVLSPFEMFTNAITGIDIGSGVDGLFKTFKGSIEENTTLINTVLGGGLIISIQNFFKGMTKMAGSFSKVGDSLADLPKTLGKTITGFAEAWNAWRKETPAESMIKIAGALAILAASLWVVAQIPEDGLIRAGQAMLALSVGLVAIVGIFSALSKLKILDPANMSQFGAAAQGFGIGIAAVAAGLWVLSNIDQEKLDKSLNILENIMVLLAGLLALVGLAGGGKSIAGTAAGVLILAAAMVVWIEVLKIWNNFDLMSVAKGFIQIVAVVAILGGALRLAGDHALGAALGLTVLSVALLILLGEIVAIGVIANLATREQLKKTFTAIVELGVLLLFMGGALRLAGPDAIKGAAGILLFSVALGVLAVAVGGLAVVSEMNNILPSTVALLLMLGSFFAITKLIDKEHLEASSKAISKFSKSVVILAAAIGVLSLLDSSAVFGSALSISMLLLALGGMTALTKESDLEATSKALLKFSAAVVVMSLGLMVLATQEWSGVLAAGVALGALLLALGGMVTMTQEHDLMATSKALIIFGAAVLSMSIGLSFLATQDWAGLLAAGAAIGVLLLALGAMVHLTQEADLMATSLALIVFGGAVVILAAALGMLSTVDGERLIGPVIALTVLIGLFGALVAVISNPAIGAMATVILPLLSIAFLAFGAACGLVSLALWVAVQAIEQLALSGPILADFAQIIASNLANFGQAALALVALGLALVPLGAGLLVFGATSAIAAGGIALLTLALNGFLELAQRVQEFNEAGANITGGIGEGISSGLGGVVEAILGIGKGILDAILGFFGIHSPSTLMAESVGQYIPEGIGLGITDNAGGMMDSLGGTLGELLGKFGAWVNDEGLPKLQEFGQGLLDKLQNEILPDILDWVKNEGLPKLGDIANDIVDHIMEELGKLPGKLLDWAAGIPGKIWEGIQSMWGTITSIGSNIVNGIVDGIRNAPSSIANALSNAASNGLNAAKRFLGISSPSRVMRDQVGRFIPEGLAVGIDEYAKVAIAASENLAKNVSNGVNKNINVDDPDFGFNYGKITPVLDMSNVEADVSNYTKQWDGLDFNAISSNIQKIDANLDLTPMLNNAMDQTNRISELTSQNQELLNEIAGLRKDMATYNDMISRMSIVMDSGTLVGELSAPMDSALGMRQNMVGRGVL